MRVVDRSRDRHGGLGVTVPYARLLGDCLELLGRFKECALYVRCRWQHLTYDRIIGIRPSVGGLIRPSKNQLQ